MTAVRSIGSYETVRVLGEGGMGTVYLARDPAIGRFVAIKVLRAGFESPTLRARLGQEGRAAGRLSHPNIVTIFHVDEEEGRPYIVMEYVEGQSLAALIRDRVHISLARKLLMLERICGGLACAHDAGLVHRDVKPANIIVDTMWEPKLLDFGLAKLPDAPLTLTNEQAVVGTISYMSPEQLSNGRVDHRTDLFAVAAVAYELMTSRRAFTGDLQQLITQILNGSPGGLLERSPEIDRDVAAVIARGLARDPDRRFQSAREMGLALAHVRRHLADGMSQVSAIEQADQPPDASRSARASRSLDVPVERSIQISWKKAAASLTLTGAAVTLVSLYSGFPGDAQPAATTSTSPAAAPASPPHVSPPAPEPRISSAVSRERPAATDIAAAGIPKEARVTPAASEPVPARREDPPAIPSARGITVPVGTVLIVSVTTSLDSRRNVPGDEFHGVLEEPVVRDGQEIVAAGARVEGRVEQSGTVSSGRAFMELSLTGLSVGQRLLPIRTGFYRAVAPSVERRPDFVAIVVGTAAGAAIGGVMGGGRGAVAGAALGAGGASVPRDTAPAEYHLGNRLPFRIAEALHIDTMP